MNFAIKNFGFLFLFMVLWPFLGTALEVKDIHIKPTGNGEVVTIELDKAAAHKVFTLDNPERLVIDLPPFMWRVNSQRIARAGSELITRIRYARFDSDTSRIVMDMQGDVRFEDLDPGNRRIKQLRLTPTGEIKAKPRVAAPNPSPVPFWSRKNTKSRPPEVVVRDEPLPTSRPRPPSEKDKPLIVIDAGHGGKDPGAKGRETREKHVTLRYARALRDALRATGKFRAELTRDSDKIILLRERFRIARRQKADMFLSLHADSAPNPKARGLSIYTLSEKASDKEAAALAKQENRVDVLADVDLMHEDEEVAGILIDLARRETKNKSVKLAETVVSTLRGKVTLLKNTHRHADFAVLKAPDIPSVLVEIGFLTNRQDERLINQREYQNKVVNGLTKAITKYFASGR